MCKLFPVISKIQCLALPLLTQTKNQSNIVVSNKNCCCINKFFNVNECIKSAKRHHKFCLKYSLASGKAKNLSKSIFEYFHINMWIFVLMFLLQRFSANAQRISTQPQKFEVRVGDTIELPCTFEDFDSNDKVVVWKRGMDVLSIDEDLTISDTKFQIKHNGMSYTLVIASLEPYDSADYICSATSNPPIEITHKLQVNVPPSAKLIPSSSLVIAKAGEEVVVKCVGAGNPPPAISWHRRDAVFNASPFQPSGAYGRLLFSKIELSDSGFYECRANNGVGDDAIATVEIRVDPIGALTEKLNEKEDNGNDVITESAPWAETDKLYISADLGSSVNLTCRYDGKPEPTVDWLFSGFKINKFDKKFLSSVQTAQREKNDTVTTFTIAEIHEDHFGDYTCKISNSLGVAKRTIYLSGRPGPPVLFVRSNNQLSWTVQSEKPILEYKVYFRLANEDIWTHHKLIAISKEDQEGEIWTHKIGLEFLKYDTDYELQVNARNELGWGSLARNSVNYRSSSKNGEILSNFLVTEVNGANKNVNSICLLVSKLFASIFFVVLPTVFLL